MRGTIRKHGKGWQFIYWVDGKQRSQAGFATKTEAETELAKRLAAFSDGLDVPPNKITVSEYLTDVWLPAVKGTVKSTTLASYSMQVNAHLVPEIGKVKLQKLTPAHVQAMYGRLAESGKIVRPKKKDTADKDKPKMRRRCLRRTGNPSRKASPQTPSGALTQLCTAP